MLSDIKQDVIHFFRQAPSMRLESRLAYFNDLFPFAATVSASFFMVTAEHNTLASNEFQLKIYGSGMSFQDTIDLNLSDLVMKLRWNPSLADEWKRNNICALQKGGTIFSETIIEPNGIGEILSTKQPIYDDNGKPLGIVGMGVRVHKPPTWIVQTEREIIFMFQKEKSIRLSFREFGILQDLLNGMTAKQIGNKLNLSPKTVETYFSNIKIKLGCSKLRDIYPFLTYHALSDQVIDYRKR